MNTQTTPYPITTRSPLQFLRLCAYGDYAHQQGLQRFDHASADAIVARFHSLRGRLTRAFGGIPVYVGHPDDPGFADRTGHSDTRAHGWIKDLQARPDGLYIKIKWSRTGQDILDNAHYKFLSPRWVLKPLGQNTYRPVRLLSVGLTNQPNIPGDAIANQKKEYSGKSVDDHSGPVSSTQSDTTDTSPELEIEIRNTNIFSNNLRAHPLAGNSPASLIECVNARMEAHDETFAQAWHNLKSSRPDLFNL